MICDFCSSPAPAWRYPARSFQSAQFQSQSFGDWAACESCSALIENNAPGWLLVRSVASFLEAHPEALEESDLVARYIHELHDMFFDNRTTKTRIAIYDVPLAQMILTCGMDEMTQWFFLNHKWEVF